MGGVAGIVKPVGIGVCEEEGARGNSLRLESFERCTGWSFGGHDGGYGEFSVDGDDGDQSVVASRDGEGSAIGAAELAGDGECEGFGWES